MYLVGGSTDTHAAFLDGLRYPHGAVVSVRAYLDGVDLGTIPIEAGQVRVTGRSQVRRRATLTVPESYWTDILSPFGVEVRIWRTITTGTHTHPLVPLFTGRVEKRARIRRAGTVVVECWDRFAAINDDAFETPRPVARMPITGAITTLIKETYPTATVTDTTGATAIIPAGLTWDAGDGSRGEAIDKMALAIGAEVVATPEGGFWIRPYPRLTDAASWWVSTGPGGVVVSDVVEESRTAVPNRWVVTGNQAGAAASVRAVVTDTTSPLRYNGPYGRVVRFHSDPMITDGSQAITAGQAMLARTQGLARQRTVGVITNPALEAGDVVAVTTEDGVEVHIADDFAIPLPADPATMTVATRSTET